MKRSLHANKGLIHQKIDNLNFYAPNSMASKYRKQKVIEWQGKKYAIETKIFKNISNKQIVNQ